LAGMGLGNQVSLTLKLFRESNIGVWSRRQKVDFRSQPF
jgi:hypothetical protein